MPSERGPRPAAATIAAAAFAVLAGAGLWAGRHRGPDPGARRVVAEHPRAVAPPIVRAPSRPVLAPGMASQPSEPIDPEEWLANGPREPLVPRELDLGEIPLAPGSVATAEPLVPRELEVSAASPAP